MLFPVATGPSIATTGLRCVSELELMVCVLIRLQPDTKSTSTTLERYGHTRRARAGQPHPACTGGCPESCQNRIGYGVWPSVWPSVWTVRFACPLQTDCYACVHPRWQRRCLEGLFSGRSSAGQSVSPRGFDRVRWGYPGLSPLALLASNLVLVFAVP